MALGFRSNFLWASGQTLSCTCSEQNSQRLGKRPFIKKINNLEDSGDCIGLGNAFPPTNEGEDSEMNTLQIHWKT